MIIIDTVNTVFEHIKCAKHALTIQCQQQQSFTPEFLAIIESKYPHKKQLFDLGIADYISSPFIDKELRYRMTHILSASLKKNSEQQFIAPSHDLPNHVTPSSLTDKRFLLIEKCVSYLSETLSEEIKLDALCRKLGTNRNKLNQVFREYLGMTVFEWLRVQRMKKAAELLETSSLNIVQIAEQVGYMDSNNFSTAFKRIYQSCPSQFRQNYRNSTNNHLKIE
ncbi:AraC family transcriptional regulator [Photobacterium galatheae]|uniref:AraC family transcriptional regulator n=1 Tax=Photobacterium galatheae TaxID=1654360 RepID=UPI00056CE97C|nr:AraC family transcriptional regulator [Photobacterium galatheae]